MMPVAHSSMIHYVLACLTINTQLYTCNLFFVKCISLFSKVILPATSPLVFQYFLLKHVSTLLQNSLGDKLHTETKEHLCSSCATFLLKTGLTAFAAQRAHNCWVFYSNLDSIFSCYFLKHCPLFCKHSYSVPTCMALLGSIKVGELEG